MVTFLCFQPAEIFWLTICANFRIIISFSCRFPKTSSDVLSAEQRAKFGFGSNMIKSRQGLGKLERLLWGKCECKRMDEGVMKKCNVSVKDCCIGKMAIVNWKNRVSGWKKILLSEWKRQTEWKSEVNWKSRVRLIHAAIGSQKLHNWKSNQSSSFSCYIVKRFWKIFKTEILKTR